MHYCYLEKYSMSEKNKEIKKEAGEPRRTIGDKIKEDTEWILATSKNIFENKYDHQLWRKTEKEIAELFLVDHLMRIFRAEQTIKAVREHYSGD